MTKQARNILKQYFQDGDTPDSTQFGHLIDSQLNLEDNGTQIIKGTISASGVSAGTFSLEALQLQTVNTTVRSGSTQFGSHSAAFSIGVTSHSFFGPIQQSSSGAHSASYFLTPVNFGTTESPIKEGGIFIKKSINLNNAGQNPLSQSISASLLISGANSHLAFDNNEITQYGIGNNLTLKSYSTLAESGGEIKFETGDSNTISGERMSVNTIKLQQTNSNSGYSNHDYGNLNVNDVLSVNDTPLLHLVNNNTTRGPFNPIVAALQNSGKCLNLDTDFWDGANSVILYDNRSGGTTTLERMLWTPESASGFNASWGEKTTTITASANTVYYKGWSSSSLKDFVSSSGAGADYFRPMNDYSLGVPNSSGYVLKIKYDGTANDANDVFPGLGGFYQNYPNPQLGGVFNQMNHTYVQVFKALLPATHEFRFNSNNQGNNNTSYWLTSNKGTGKWEWYARVNHVGDEIAQTTNDGYLSPITSAGHIYINNIDSSPVFGTPVTCYLASCTVYDMTEADALTHRRIGIGTINPKAAGLHINATETIASQGNPVSQSINASMLLSGSNGQQLSFDSNEIHHYGNNLYITAQGNSSDDGNIKFRTAINSDNTVLNDDNNTRLYISASGNVGIGTTTPGQTLEVIGHISASGTIYADAINGVINPVGGLKLNDNEFLKIGTGDDLKLYHNATNSWILNETGDLNIRNEANDGDIIFSCDDNGGNTVNYYVIDGGTRKNMFYQPVEISGTTLTVGSTSTFNGNVTLSGTNTLTVGGNVDFNGDLDVDGTTNLDVVDIDSTLNVQGVATFQNNIKLGDGDKILIGGGDDLEIQHNSGGTNNTSITNKTGNLSIINTADDKDIIFSSDNGSGGVAEYFKLDGSEVTINFSKKIIIGTNAGDNGKDVIFYGDTANRYMTWDASGNTLDFRDTTFARFGDSNDLKIWHNGTDSFLANNTGHFNLMQNANDKNMSFQCDDGNGFSTEYFRLDGSTTTVKFSKKITDSSNVPIIARNINDVSMGGYSGKKNSGTYYLAETTSGTTGKLVVGLTLKTTNPKILVSGIVTLGGHSGTTSFRGKIAQTNSSGAVISGGSAYTGFALMSGIDEDNKWILGGGAITPKLLGPVNADAGETIYFGIFVNSSKEFYFNRNEADGSVSTAFSYMTIEEIPQANG